MRVAPSVRAAARELYEALAAHPEHAKELALVARIAGMPVGEDQPLRCPGDLVAVGIALLGQVLARRVVLMNPDALTRMVAKTVAAENLAREQVPAFLTGALAELREEGLMMASDEDCKAALVRAISRIEEDGGKAGHDFFGEEAPRGERAN